MIPRPPWQIAPAVRAITYMLLSALLLTTVDTVSKTMMRDGLHPIEIVFFRNLFGMAALAPVYLRIGLGALRSKHPGGHVMRNLVQASSIICYFWALSYMPIAEAAALGFMSSIYTAIGAVIFLKEPAKPMRWISIAIGILGMLIIVRPGFSSVSFGMMLIMFANVGGAATRLMTKNLSRVDSAATIVVYMSLTVTVATFVPSLFVWKWPTLEQWLWLVAIGGIGSLAQVLATAALRWGDVTAVEPMSYTRLVWAAILGFAAFGELPGPATLLGGAVIITGAILLMRSETRAVPRTAAAG